MKHNFMFLFRNADANAKAGALVVVKAVNDKLPDALKLLHYGEVLVTDPKEVIDALRGHIRSAVLKQFGIQSINKTVVSTAPLGFNENNVQTRLKLPKPTQRLNGDWAENLEAYWKRVMPVVQQWLRNSIHNSTVSADFVKTLD